MCVQNSPSHKPTELSFDDFRAIIDSVPSVMFCNIQGNGEPLINPMLIDMIHYAVSRGIAPITCTNAMLLTEQLAQQLVTSGLYECAVSLESPQKDLFEYLRKGADFNVFKDNIALLVKTRNRLNPHLILSFWITITNHTHNYISDCIAFAAQSGFDHIVFQQVQCKEVYRSNYTISFGVHESPTLAAPLSEKQFLRRYRSEAKKHGITISLPSVCLWPWSGFFVMSNGNITPCCSIHGTDEYIISNIHLLQSDLYGVWNSKRMQVLRESFFVQQTLTCCDQCNFS